MRIEMTCCCGASFSLDADRHEAFPHTLYEEAERWRNAHALCPTYPRTVTTETMAQEKRDE